MENQIIFRKGQKVSVEQHMNASDFNITREWSAMGVYSIDDCYNKVFEIEGTVKLITFKDIPEVYGAYLLTLDGKKVGYIYNCGIKEIVWHPEKNELVKWNGKLHRIISVSMAGKCKIKVFSTTNRITKKFSDIDIDDLEKL